jgi:hypothetical protein
MSLRQIRRRTAQDLVLLLEELDPLVRLTQRIRLTTGPGLARGASRVALVDREPPLQARRRDAEVLRDLGDGQCGQVRRVSLTRWLGMETSLSQPLNEPGTLAWTPLSY